MNFAKKLLRGFRTQRNVESEQAIRTDEEDATASNHSGNGSDYGNNSSGTAWILKENATFTTDMLVAQLKEKDKKSSLLPSKKSSSSSSIKKEKPTSNL